MEGNPRTPDTPPSVLKAPVAQRPGLFPFPTAKWCCNYKCAYLQANWDGRMQMETKDVVTIIALILGPSETI
jgi:hypothetical protein